MRFALLVGMLTLISLVAPSGVRTQEDPGTELINLFFDCQAPYCHDLDYFRREIPFVNWVRDREVGDVHLLIRSERTGGGGIRYELSYIGLGDFEGVDDEIVVLTAGDATTEEQRSAIAERTKLGLVPYVRETPAGEHLRVVFGNVTGEQGPQAGPGRGPPPGVRAQEDPWDFWVFRIGANAFLDGQATLSSSRVFANISADRTTDAWKLSFGGNFSRYVQKFEISDGSTIEEIRRDWGTNALAVRSIGGQWAVGVKADVGSSTFLNQDLRWSVKPGLEYNFFPYSESSRRSLTLQYLVGPNHFNYTEETIFFKTSETVGQQSLTGELSLVEQWGRWSTSLTTEQYLHDTSKYSVTLRGNFNIRLFQGFSIRMTGNYSWIRDQLFISVADATDAEILLRQRQLETSYRYFTSFGFEYRFGSIFNNVVNPRFGGSGGEIFF